MYKPTIFAVSTVWDAEAGVWSGPCDEIPAAADAPTLDTLLDKSSAIALDLAPFNYPSLNPGDIFIQIIALGEAAPMGG